MNIVVVLVAVVVVLVVCSAVVVNSTLVLLIASCIFSVIHRLSDSKPIELSATKQKVTVWSI